ncbi:MAG: hypothetical protein ACRDWX_12830 [Acidimicrobiia bacterium]
MPGRIALLMVALVMLAPACNRGRQSSTTLPTETLGTVAAPERTTTTSPAEDGGPQPAASTIVSGTPGYTIVERIPGEGGAGDTVVVVLEEGDYDTREIENAIIDLIDTYAPIQEAHIVDTQQAADAVLEASPTPEQQEELELHYFARLEEGNRLTYLGPYADSGVIIIGS